ncbi:MAG: extracellular solute-binding protein [Anaerolineae bacterium]|nr:MAG: extracellular solute-binding protein [Anaerolineae bacterium]
MRALSRREFLKVAGLAAIGLGLGACAPKEGAKGGVSPGKEDVALELWWHEYGEEGTHEAALRIAKEYSEQTEGVTLESVWNPGDYNQKLDTALAAGTGPDAYESQANIDKVANGYCIALDEVFEETLNDWSPADLNRVTIKGHKYGIPMMVDFQMFCLRPSMLKAAGVSTPTNWDELVEAGIACTSGRQKGLFLGNDGGLGTCGQRIARAAGVNFFMEEDDTPEIRFNQDETVMAWEKLADLHANHSDILLTGAPSDWWDPGAFNQGMCAIQWMGFWSTAMIIDAVGDDYEFIAFPPVGSGPNAKNRIDRGGWVALVNGQGEHIPEATALQKWLWVDNTDFQIEWNTAYGYKALPRISLNAQVERLKAGQPKHAVEMVNEYGYVVGQLWSGVMGTAVSDAVTNIVKNGADARSEMQTAYDKCVAELDIVLEKVEKLPG